jgi:hemerythrin
MAEAQETIQWSADLSIGIEAIDEDHKTFFIMANILLSAIRDNPPELETITQSAIAILYEYVTGHFLREERAMERSGYPDHERHRALHDAFKGQVLKLAEAYENGDKDAAKRLAELVLHWVRAHIADVDKRYAGIIKPEHVDTRPLALLSMEAEGEDGGGVGLLGTTAE